MEILPYGNNALLVQFEQNISPEIHADVVATEAFASQLEGVEYQIPAYCSLAIIYDPKKTNFEQLKNELDKQIFQKRKSAKTSRKLIIPVCYGGDFGPDLSELAEQKGLTPTELIALHTGKSYEVYMMGFLPGFPYLGILDDHLVCSRKANPRKKVASGSVGLAGMQTGIYPTDAPGGWQLIGRTPIPIFNAALSDPFVLRVGDQILFKAISEVEFEQLSKNSERYKIEQVDEQ